MGVIFLILVSIFFSFYFFGIVRTALWILPSMWNPALQFVSSAVFLSFLSALILIVPYQSECFDARGLGKEKKTVIFFISGLLSGSLMYSTSPTINFFLIGAIAPYFFYLICSAIRHPIPYVSFRRRVCRILVPLSWVASVVLVTRGI